MLVIRTHIDPSNNNNWRHFLGRTSSEIAQTMGKPFASYSFRDQEIFLYDSKPLTSISIQNGIVVTCNDIREARKTRRVSPENEETVIFNRDCKKVGRLNDISITAASICVFEDTQFSLGEKAIVSLSLTIDGIARYLEIPCIVHDSRDVAGSRSTIFLFDLSADQWKKRILSRYISLRTAQTALALDSTYLWS
jgi:hypothetical protein